MTRRKLLLNQFLAFCGMQDALAPTLMTNPRVECSSLRSHATAFGVTVAVLCLAAFCLPAIFPGWGDLSAVYLVRQDRWLLLCHLIVLVAVVLVPRRRAGALSLPAWTPYALAAVVFCFCLAGHRWILDDYDLSRDEQMAVFDSRIFATARLAQPLPAFWQAHADALNTVFMLPVSYPVAWVSAYLPMNAAIRALVGLVVDPAVTGPAMTGLGLLFLWRCARRLWPQEQEPAVVAALLYLGSGQILFAGMTSYAMPAYLTLDLLWLWLFLVRRPITDAGALLVALVATGLHQPLFHPLFALPFLVGLVRDRSWGRMVFYATGYAAICAFWMAWPMMMHTLVTGDASWTESMGTDYLTRLVATLKQGDTTRWADTAANLLRFAAWQPVLLLPLMGAGLVLTRRERPTIALAVSVVLPIAVMAIILPYQGHGFGYRYLHGVMGCAILLAVQGWRRLVRNDGRLRPLLLRAAAAGLIVALPLQAWMAHALFAPYAQADARIRANNTDYVIIGLLDAPFAKDLVLNRPDLSNRPIRLLAEHVDNGLISAICRPGVRVAMPMPAFFARIDAEFPLAPSLTSAVRLERLSPKLGAAGCTIERLDGS